MKKVQVRALTGGVIETESVGGFIQAGVMSVMNQAYSKLNSAKVKDGLARRRAAGHYAIGMVPFGYAYRDGLVVPHPDNWGPARERWERLMAMEMNLMGYCREYGGVSRSGLMAWVKNPMLRGVVPHQQGGVKPLVSAEEWVAAKQLLSRRTRSRVPTGNQLRTHLFSSLIACDACGRSLQVQRTASGKRRWKCVQPQCDWFGRSIAEQLVRQQAIEALRQEAPRLALEAQRASNARVTEKTSEQVAVENKVAQLEALRDSGVPELGTSIDALRTQLADMARPTMGPDWSGLAELIAAPGVLERFTDKQLRPLLLEYVAKFRYVGNPRQVEVVLKEGH